MHRWKVVAIAGIVIVLGAAVCVQLLQARRTVQFDGAAWTAEKNWDRDNPRWKMIPSLLRDNKLIGMTKLEIIQLLGPPDGVDDRINDSLEVPVAAVEEATIFNYVLGAHSGFGMDYDILSVEFGQAGKVTSHRVWQS